MDIPGLAPRAPTKRDARKKTVHTADSIGGRIGLARLASSLSQKTVSPIVGITKTRISLIETGQKLPTIEEVVAFAHLFDVKVSTLLDAPYEDDAVKAPPALQPAPVEPQLTLVPPNDPLSVVDVMLQSFQPVTATPDQAAHIVEINKQFEDLAISMAVDLPKSVWRTICIRSLIDAKSEAIRAVCYG